MTEWFDKMPQWTRNWSSCASSTMFLSSNQGIEHFGCGAGSSPADAVLGHFMGGWGYASIKGICHWQKKKSCDLLGMFKTRKRWLTCQKQIKSNNKMWLLKDAFWKVFYSHVHLFNAWTFHEQECLQTKKLLVLPTCKILFNYKIWKNHHHCRPPEAPSYVCLGKHPKSVLKSPIIGGWNPLFQTGMACTWCCTWVTCVTDIQKRKKKILRYAGNQEAAFLCNLDTQKMYLHYKT